MDGRVVDGAVVDVGMAMSSRPRSVGHRSYRSLRSQRSILSIASEGSILSIGSAYSVLSIGSVGSFLSVGSAGSAASALSSLSFGSLGSCLSALSRWSLLSWKGVHSGPDERPPFVVTADETDPASHCQS